MRIVGVIYVYNLRLLDVLKLGVLLARIFKEFECCQHVCTLNFRDAFPFKEVSDGTRFSQNKVRERAKIGKITRRE
jgi:hypothetical protein